MKKNYLRVLIMFTKLSAYGFLLQTILFTTIFAMDSEAQVRSVKEVYVNLFLKSVKLEEALSQIEKQTNFVFVYAPGELSDDNLVNIAVRNKPVYEALFQLSKQARVKFKQVNQNISIHKMKDKDEAAPIEIIMQGFTVTGKVTAEDSEGLPGVSIVIKGTTTGTVSDFEGSYSIEAPSPNATLVFSFVGYTTEEIEINNRSVIDVSLVSDVRALEEIVVIGYGSQKKSLVTGAISSVSADDLETVSNSRIDQALQGRTSGVSITPTSGSPGSPTKIRIRGVSSNGNADPLFIIDGVRTGAEGMDFLSPNDVQSIEVLKDAASAAIYGAEGANGVIIVTTKSGQKNASEFIFSSQFGSQSVRPDMMKTMNPIQYQRYMAEAGMTNIPSEAEAQATVGTNWMDEVFSTAPIQNHSLSFRGGTNNSTFFLSGSYFDQDGIVGGSKSQFERYTFRINSSHDLKPWLSVGENLSYTNFQKAGVAEDDEFRSVLSSALSMDPYTPVIYTGALPANVTGLTDAEKALLRRDANGNLYGIPAYVDGEFGNPLQMIDMEKQRTNQSKILGNLYADIKPIAGLTVTTRLGIDAAWQRFHDWEPTYYQTAINQNTVATGEKDWEEWFNWQLEEFASYHTAFGRQNLTVLGGASIVKNDYNRIFGSYSGLFKEEGRWSQPDNVGNAGDRIGGTANTQVLLSFFGRLSYDFAQKYQFEATLRRDGSSLLAEGRQWGTFPSLSVGWVLSEENFFAQNNVVSYAKLRASWGQNGSLSNLDPGLWQASISTTVDDIIQYPNALGQYVFGAAPTQLPNSALTWETSEQIDIGLDLSFIDEQLELTVDYFKKTTQDLITKGNPPGFSGLGIPFLNAGNVENRGFEFELSFRSKPARTFRYEIAANMTTLKNEVTGLSSNGTPPDGADIGTHWRDATGFDLGQPVWYFRGYKTDGTFQDQEQVDAYMQKYSGYDAQPGDPVIVDVNDDKLISPADYTNIGNPHPNLYYGARVNLSYKGFDLLAFLQGQSGADVMLGFIRTDRGTANKPLFMYEERWTGANSTNSGYRASASGNVFTSDKMIYNGSYARIRQLQLGYTLPQMLLEGIGLSNVRFYVSLDNYFTFTNYPGFDPEAGSPDNNSIGIDRAVYPIPRSVLGGVSLSF